ncbi:MAG: hypothetical protein SVR08_16950 [Spirochaetota bacterium]|nr:hypothetical protein [Spirochaetota bacterium]
MSHEINEIRVPTQLCDAEGNKIMDAMASVLFALRGRRPYACGEVQCAEPGRSQGLPYILAG